MKDWAEDLLDTPMAIEGDAYWLRIPDGVYGNIRPADGVLFAFGKAAMVEHKVDRRKTHVFSTGMLTAHQLRSCRGFRGFDRVSFAVIFHGEDAHLYSIESGLGGEGEGDGWIRVPDGDILRAMRDW